MSQASSPYEAGLDKNAANFVPLSPIGFLLRSAAVYPERTAVIYGERRYTWRQSLERCRRLASALAARGVGRGDTVALMAPNVPEAFEAHFGVPMAGAVLNALNIRLDAETIAFILKHGEAKVLITDTEFSPTIGAALALLDNKPLVIDIADPQGPGGINGGQRLGDLDYENPRAMADWARRMGEASGVDLGSDYEEMLEEMEQGGDMEGFGAGGLDEDWDDE